MKPTGWPLQPPGPPGCGKTYFARAVSGECGATFFNVGIHDIPNLYVVGPAKFIVTLSPDLGIPAGVGTRFVDRVAQL